MNEGRLQLTWVRIWLALFMGGLLLAGLSAIPIKSEVDSLHASVGEGSRIEAWWPGLATWISRVHRGVTEADREYPFLFYGTDWLAFGHLVIAIAFIGPLKDPVRYAWVIDWGMIACVLVIPWALLFGPARGIPFFWQLIDCWFGIVGIVPLYLARRLTKRLAHLRAEQTEPQPLPETQP